MIQPEDRVLELGVHYGFYASFISNHLKGGAYLGVELQPKSAMYAHSNLSLNGFKNSQILNAAAGSKKGVISYEPFQNGNANVSKNTETKFKMDVVAADDLAQEYGDFTFLKIDVEGFELEVLKGAKKLLSKKPKLAIELHNPFLSKQEIIDIFELIDTENYEGQMFIRPSYQMEKFDKDKAIKSENIVNIFLTPKIN